MKQRMFKSRNFQSSIKLLFYFLLFIGTQTFAQSPELNIKGEGSTKVRMSQLIVNVNVVGNIAYTTAEMHFFNSGNRQMEAELIFPLPENVSVSRYAIDINGKMREAVPVNKSKGKQVFEAIEHRRVDPGLLEKVDGNNFRTRIYPLMPNDERIVIIGYEEELSAFDKNNVAYQLVSRYPTKLDKFEINVAVLGTSSAPKITENSGNVIAFSKWNQSFQASLKKENYKPLEKLVFKIPIQENSPELVTQNSGGQYYFYGNTFVQGNKVAKKAPNSIGLIWDSSLSCQTRDLQKELSVLEAYFQNIKNTKVTLYFLNYSFEKQKEFIITNGNWSELKAVLENTKYDGGTRFSQINFLAHDEYLFFSDGLSSLSDNVLPKTKKPVYTITSSVSADFAFLNYSAMQTGVDFINLNQISTENAVDKLVHTNLRFLGIKENFMVTDLFPIPGTSVSGSFSFSGISLNAKNEVTLLFGYNNEVASEQKITLDAVLQNTNNVNVEKLWAQKKIANLDYQYAKNAEEIETLGKKYGIITRNTSLIVLENIQDYILYDIIPPAELREEFDRIKRQQQDNNFTLQKSNWESVENYFTALKSWWRQDIKYVVPEPVQQPKITTSRRLENINLTRNTDIPIGMVSGIVLNNYGKVLFDVKVKVNNKEVYSNFEGKFSIKADENSVLSFSLADYESVVLNMNGNNQVTVKLQGNSSSLDEVVILTPYEKPKRRSMDYAVQEVRSETTSRKAENRPARSTPEEEKRKGKSERRAQFSEKDKKPGSEIIQEDQEQPVGKAPVTELIVDERVETTQDGNNFRGNQGAKNKIGKEGKIEIVSGNNIQSVNNEDQPKTWNPDRLYLKALAAVPKEKQEELYFELRKEQERNPSFYFDVAHFYYNQGDTKKALMILSNIADLGLENHQLYKTLTYTLRQWQDYEDSLFTASQVVKWRAHEPQSLRDYALTLEEAGKYQEAFDQLIKALEVNYYGEMNAHHTGIEDVILMDINRLVTEHSYINTYKLDKKYLDKMPVDIRIILNWNMMDVDIDLHVIEPNGEECYYSHKKTEAGARFSKDFTQGYGPEQYLIRNAIKGKYLIKSNYYGHTKLTENGPSTVLVEIYTTKAGKTSKTLKTIQLGKIKKNEVLAEIVW